MAKRDMGTRTMTNSEIQDRTCVRPSFRSRGCCRTGQPRRPVGERRSWRLRAGPKAASHASCVEYRLRLESGYSLRQVN
jgi:hypothetical protein